jgi:hypothetical protein
MVLALTSSLRALLEAVALLVVILVYYGVAATRVNAWVTRRALERTSLVRRYSRMEATGVVRLGVASGLQLAFVLVLALVGAIDASVLLPPTFRPILLVYGAILGVAEMALGSFVCNVAMRISQRLLGEERALDSRAWFVASKGGWMRSFTKAVEIMPAPVVLALFLLYVGMEETVFRGIVVNATRGLGTGVALVVSTLMFVAVQVFHTPTWRTAMFPVIGALIMGVVHGWLYLAVPDLTPLVVAHLAFFAAATL